MAMTQVEFEQTALVVVAVITVFALSRHDFTWRPSAWGTTLRLMVRMSPYFIPAILLPSPSWQVHVPALAIALFFLFFALAFEMNELRLGLLGPLPKLMPPLRPIQKAYRCIRPLSSAFAQEYLYRFAVLVVARAMFGVLAAVGISVSLFVLEHRFHAGSDITWDRHDYLAQTWIATGAAVAFIWSGSLFASVCLHAAYNLPSSIEILRRPTAADGRTSAPQSRTME